MDKPRAGHTEVGKDQVGNIVLVVTAPTQTDGLMSAEFQTVYAVFSQDQAVKLADAIKRASFSEDVNFIWTGGPVPALEPEGIRN